MSDSGTDSIVVIELTDINDISAQTHLIELDTSADILRLPTIGDSAVHAISMKVNIELAHRRLNHEIRNVHIMGSVCVPCMIGKSTKRAPAQRWSIDTNDMCGGSFRALSFHASEVVKMIPCEEPFVQRRVATPSDGRVFFFFDISSLLYLHLHLSPS